MKTTRWGRNQVSELRGILLFLMGSRLLSGLPPTALANDPHHPFGQHPPASVQTQNPGATQQLGLLFIPDVTLMNQDGEQVHFYHNLVKDKVVVINFIFTTCTTICSPMGANFARLQTLIGERIGRDVQLISVSIDPVIDTPQRLKAWSKKFQAGPGWTLLTGPKHEVARLLKALGVFTADKGDHAPLILVGNEATGRWTRAYGLAPPEQLAEIITTLTHPGTQTSALQEVHTQ